MSPHDGAQYEPIPKYSREQIRAALERDDPADLLHAVLAAALYDPELEWAEALCLRLATHPNFTVRGNALLGFGHLARLHGRLDRAKVQPVIQAGLHDSDDYVRGHANDAADDAEHFLGWRFSRPVA
jgi:hypothetical protein